MEKIVSRDMLIIFLWQMYCCAWMWMRGGGGVGGEREENKTDFMQFSKRYSQDTSNFSNYIARNQAFCQKKKLKRGCKSHNSC